MRSRLVKLHIGMGRASALLRKTIVAYRESLRAIVTSVVVRWVSSWDGSRLLQHLDVYVIGTQSGRRIAPFEMRRPSIMIMFLPICRDVVEATGEDPQWALRAVQRAVGRR